MAKKGIILLILCINLFADSAEIPRTIIALYAKDENTPKLQFSNIHKLLELPLNHLGLTVEYHNIDKGFPDIFNRKDVRGIITWFNEGYGMKNPQKYIDWVSELSYTNKKIVVLGCPGIDYNQKGGMTPRLIVNDFWNIFGLYDIDSFQEVTYNSKIDYADKNIINFERKYPETLPKFNNKTIISDETKIHLSIKNGDEIIPLITTSKNGSFVAENYAYNLNAKYSYGKQWYINPFEFLRIAFDTDDLPKPDVTTIAGKRIYFSHIDGDAWRSLTWVERFIKKKLYVSRVIMQEAIIPYPDMPVTVGPVGADLDKDYLGNNKAQKVAYELLKLPQVELGSHTYTHPMEWSFFKNYSLKDEEPYFHKYKSNKKKKEKSFLLSLTNQLNDKEKEYCIDTKLSNNYEVPRAFGNEAFDLNKELFEGFEIIESFAPKNKKVTVLQWSGDTSPFEKVIRELRKNHYYNINGGDGRFDRKFPSYGFTSPIGRQVGKERQIYAVCSNENTYTEEWTENFHAYKYLQQTLWNTESPIRIKPINIYYHFYTGEKDSSLQALIDNLEYSRNQNIIPITTSNYCQIADSFYKVKIEKIDNAFHIKNRNHLQTIRFDKASYKHVDFANSAGVIGQKHHQGSLYVYLDKSVETPIIILKETPVFWKEETAETAFIIESRWQIWNLRTSQNKIEFLAKGFGQSKMILSVPENGGYTVMIDTQPYSFIAKNNLLKFNVDNEDLTKVKEIQILKTTKIQNK